MYENIPAELKQLRQWCLWKKVVRGGKPTKAPFQPDGTPAVVNESATWCSYEKAIIAAAVGEFDGIGLMFSPDGPYCGIDMDKCIENGKQSEAANKLLKRVGSYAERSQSLEGLHIIIKGKKPGDRCKFNKLPGMKEMEIYDSGRFFVMTGNHIIGTPTTVEDRQEMLNAIYARAMMRQEAGAQEKRSRTSIGQMEALSDETVIELLGNAKNSNKFNRLYYGGDMSDQGNDWSRADQALCNMVAFYTTDPEQIERIFNGSALVRDKWTKRDKYREQTIQRAINGLTSTYRGKKKSPGAGVGR